MNFVWHGMSTSGEKTMATNFHFFTARREESRKDLSLEFFSPTTLLARAMARNLFILRAVGG
jgi:hypothetical protein